MSWNAVEKHLADCQKNPGATVDAIQAAGPSLPTDYADLLAHANGLEGFLEGDHYLMLWPIEDLQEMNSAYSTAEFLPGVTLLGTDGGDTGYGYDADCNRYVAVPLVGMEPDEVNDLGGSLQEWIENVVAS